MRGRAERRAASLPDRLRVAADDSSCGPDLVIMLDEEGAQPTIEMLDQTAKHECWVSFRGVAKRLPPLALARYARERFEAFGASITDVTYIEDANRVFPGEWLSGVHDPLVEQCAGSKDAKCAGVSAEWEGVRAAIHANEMKIGPNTQRRDYERTNREAAEAKEQERADEESNKNASRAHACSTLDDMHDEQRILREERQIGRVAGVINAKVMYDAGERYIEAKKEYDEAVTIYRSWWNKAFKPSVCRLTGLEE